jgi:hypothetical protein
MSTMGEHVNHFFPFLLSPGVQLSVASRIISAYILDAFGFSGLLASWFQEVVMRPTLIKVHVFGTP